MRKSRFLFIALGFMALFLLTAPVSSCRASHKGPRPNILLITVGSMRWDYMSALEKTLIETPVMNRLARDGVLFDNVMVSAPLSRVSHASIFTGLYPPQHHVRDDTLDSLSPETDTLAAILKKNGYRTGAIVGGLPLVRNSGLNQGFDYYDDTMIDAYYENRVGQATSLPVEVRASQVNERAISWLRDKAANHGPWFLWVHYYDPNAPYNPPSPFDLVYSDKLYAGEVAYVDANIGILLEEIHQLGMQSGTLIVLTSDHGEGLGEHGEDFSGWQVYDSTSRVFAGFTWPGVIPAGKLVSETVRNIDLFATILDLAGISSPQNRPSRSLKPLFGGRASGGGNAEPWPPAYTESLTFNHEMKWLPIYSIKEGAYHYIQMKDGELYDTAHDPMETNNLVAVKPEEARRLSEVLDRVRNEMKRGKGAPETLGVVQPGPKANELGKEQILSIMKLLEEASAAFGQGKSDEAISLFKKILETDPDAVRIYFALGKIFARQRNHEEALKYFDEFIARSSGKAKARGLAEEGAVWMDKKDPLRAEKLLKESIQLNPDYPMAHFNLGMTYGQEELIEEAEKEFEIALRLDPSFAAAHYGMGLVLARDARRQTAALQEFLEALKYNPDLAEAHLSIGFIFGGAGKLKDVPKAIFHLERALSIEPNIQNGDEARKILAELKKKNEKK